MPKRSADENINDLIDAVDAMEVGDELRWDVANIRTASEAVRRRAALLGSKLTTRSDPPRTAAKQTFAGRILIRRVT